MPTAANKGKQESPDNWSKDVSFALDTGRWTRLKIEVFTRGYASPGKMIKDWIDGGMPLTAVNVEKQPTAGVEEAAGKWLATVKLLEEEVIELKDRLKLAQASNRQATPVASNEREKQLLRDWHEVSGKLEKAEANLLLVMTTSDQQAVKIGKLEAKIVELTKGVRPVAVAPSMVSDFDQSPEADELRKKPVVSDPNILPNGFPVGKTMGADGSLVDAEEAGF